ncbi:Uncharacterised protein [Mycobacteroides abscessus subsp. abscessus]|nr:Uncharacterised protein [Mycobacteroides abscessus subsp. abscessus]
MNALGAGVARITLVALGALSALCASRSLRAANRYTCTIGREGCAVPDVQSAICFNEVALAVVVRGEVGGQSRVVGDGARNADTASVFTLRPLRAGGALSPLWSGRSLNASVALGALDTLRPFRSNVALGSLDASALLPCHSVVSLAI